MVSSQFTDTTGYKQPSNVKEGERFFIKLQESGPPGHPLEVYDKSRECHFYICPGTPGFDALTEVVNSESFWYGHKTFIMASFDAQGMCTVYPGITTLKRW